MDPQLNKDGLLAAIGRDEIVVFYQPQVSAISGELVAVECLARWNHRQLGVLAPAAFLPLIENDEASVQMLGEAVLKQAVRDAAHWPDLTIALNVSPIQFRLPQLADRVVNIIQAAGFAPSRLELEILETSYFENPVQMCEVLTRLRSQGIRIALDDFGTGYSSLAALMELPLDKLKIDGSFVRKSGTIRSAAIIHAVVALARGIELKVTAEGVENEEQRSFLRAAGCHYLQGYLFGKPMPAGDFSALVAARAAPTQYRH